jgi:hypothetical protein
MINLKKIRQNPCGCLKNSHLLLSIRAKLEIEWKEYYFELTSLNLDNQIYL